MAAQTTLLKDIALVDSTPLVAVILLTWNQREKTLRCLESFQLVRTPSFQIFLWDNGSSDGTVEAVRSMYPDVLVNHSTDNLGVASGRNAGAHLAIHTFQPPFLLFLDNDMTVTPNFLAALMAPFSLHPDVAVTTGKIRSLGTDQLYGACGCRVDFVRGRTNHIGHGEVDQGQYDLPGECLPSGGCMLVRMDIFQALNGFDPAFNPYGPEDLDFDLRARKAGYRLLYVPDAIVYHEPHSGRTASAGQYSSAYVMNKMQRWMVFLRRHASPFQKLGFYFYGAFIAGLRILVREGLRGNLSALKGLVRGLVKLVHP